MECNRLHSCLAQVIVHSNEQDTLSHHIYVKWGCRICHLACHLFYELIVLRMSANARCLVTDLLLSWAVLLEECPCLDGARVWLLSPPVIWFGSIDCNSCWAVTHAFCALSNNSWAAVTLIVALILCLSRLQLLEYIDDTWTCHYAHQICKKTNSNTTHNYSFTQSI